jgi:hypothetical protein
MEDDKSESVPLDGVSDSSDESLELDDFSKKLVEAAGPESGDADQETSSELQ